jgi:hypothetical protein
MVGDCNDGGIEIGRDIADWCDCDSGEGTIEVPMLEAMRIACDDRCFITVCVVGVIAVTVGLVIFVVVFVMVIVRFVGAIVAMDVRIVSAAVPMMNQAHDAMTVRCSDSNLPYRPSDLLWQDIRYGLEDTSIVQASGKLTLRAIDLLREG